MLKNKGVVAAACSCMLRELGIPANLAARVRWDDKATTTQLRESSETYPGLLTMYTIHVCCIELDYVSPSARDMYFIACN